MEIIILPDYCIIKTIFISFITELELLGYQGISEEEYRKIEEFLRNVTIIDINAITTKFKRTYTLKLPDAIIVATAHYMSLPLMTADKDLNKLEEVNILQHTQ